MQKTILLILISVKILAEEKTNKVIINYSFTLLEIISLSTAIISISLGIFAIWLTLYLKKEADSMNKETKEILTKIRIDAGIITNGVTSEIEKWGNFSRERLTSSPQTKTNGGTMEQGSSTQGGK